MNWLCWIANKNNLYLRTCRHFKVDQDKVERRRAESALQSFSGRWRGWDVGVWGLGRSTGQERSLEMELWYVMSGRFFRFNSNSMLFTAVFASSITLRLKLISFSFD